jgi:DNA-binding response OmpR family regulator
MAKIAIIDDDPDIVEATTLLLESKGHTVVSAGNVDDGFALVEEQKPDLIILDVMMVEPDDGFYLASKLRKKGYQTPIIMLTSIGKAIGMNFVSHDKVPVNEFLEKPISPSILMDKVAHYLSQQ